MEPDLSVPAVVAVVVTHDPGPWFEETLASLKAQDYPNLVVLVIDTASTDDPTARVAAVLPRAFVRRLDTPVGFGRAANEVTEIVEGASHFLFCHDDVALEPDAIRLLVEEAFRSNAGILSPKMTEWHRPDRLVAVGSAADKVGVVAPLVERGEMDQEQHDVVRDVFVAPSGATLVRADLFATLGGFDAVVDDRGEDLNLSWRAHLAGARVVVVPAARVRHLEATTRGLRAGRPASGERDAVGDAHRVSTVLTCYSLPTLVWIVPLLVVYALTDAAAALLTGRPGAAATRLRSVVAPLTSPAALRRSRRNAQSHRRVRDRAVRRLQSRGNARLRAWLRARIDGPGSGLPFAEPGTLRTDDEAGPWARPPRVGPARRSREAPGPGRPPRRRSTRRRVPEPDGPGVVDPGTAVAAGFGVPDASSIGTGGWRLPVVTGVAVLVLLLVGSRSLFGHVLPDVAQIPVTSAGIGSWWRAWWSTWQPAALGSVGPSAPALGLLSAAGVVTFGALGTLQHVLVLAPLAIGPIGAYRAARWWGSARGRLVTAVAYVLVPLPYDALAKGHWDALLVFAAAPWVVGLLGRLSDSLPYPATKPAAIAGRVAGLGLLVAVVAAFVPSFVVVVAVAAAGLALGSLLVAQVPTATRLVGTGVVAAVGAAVLLLPWSARVATSRVALFGAPVGPAGRSSFAALLRMHLGPVGAGPLGWGLLVAAALPLVIGRSWRLAWAARMWVMLLLLVLWAWMGLRGWVPAPPADVALAPAAAGLAASVGLGVVAFELDLPGYRFGWRQGASALAALGLLVTALPVVTAAGGGRWHLPSSGASSVLAAEESSGGGDYRILWVGAPDAIPMASAPLGGGAAFATSYDGGPDVTDEWTDGSTSGAGVFRQDLDLAADGRTTELGHLLAPLGVRYLVLPNHNAPAGSGATAEPSPSALTTGLLLQTDLRPLDPDLDYTVYLNAAWAPARAALAPSAARAATVTGAAVPRVIEDTDLAGSAAVLAGGQQDHVTGSVDGGTTVLVADGSRRAWTLRVGGRTLHASPAFGAALAFAVPADAGGTATLTAATSGVDHVGQIVVVALWVIVVGIVVLDRRRRVRSGTPDETVRPEWFTPLAPHGVARRRSAAISNAPVGMDSDELWVDA